MHDPKGTTHYPAVQSGKQHVTIKTHFVNAKPDHIKPIVDIYLMAKHHFTVYLDVLVNHSIKQHIKTP